MRRRIVLLLTAVLLLLRIPVALADQDMKAYCVAPLGSAVSVAELNADEPMRVAGLSKLPAVLTLCNAFDSELIDRNATVTVSQSASKINGPTAFLQATETISATELIRAAVMISAGDAIWALMEHAFGSEEVFLQNISLMLHKLGIEKTMSGCLGTDDSFSCRELILLSESAMNSETFRTYCAEKYAILHHADGRETELASANKLLSTLSGCVGLFTGSSKTDGYCGLFACKRGDTTFLCAVLGAPNSKSRSDAATKLLEEAFANYKTVTLAEPSEPVVPEWPVAGTDGETVDLFAKESVTLLLKKSDGEPDIQFDLPDALTPPLDPKFSVGTATFYAKDGSVLSQLALYPDRAIVSSDFRSVLMRVFQGFLSN